MLPKLLIRLTFASILAMSSVGPAGATVADDLCLPTDDPCIITGNQPITNPSVLDFGTRDVILEGTLNHGSGELTVLAGSFTIAAQLQT